MRAKDAPDGVVAFVDDSHLARRYIRSEDSECDGGSREESLHVEIEIKVNELGGSAECRSS